MKIKESKGISLIAFTIVLAVLVIVAGGVIVYLLNNPVKEGTTIQTPTNVEDLNSSEKVEVKLSTAEALNIGKDLFEKQDKIIDKLYTEGNYYKDNIVVITKTLKDEIYSLLTDNAIKEIETKCKYKEENGKFYYDTEWLDPMSVFGNTDVGRKELVVQSITEDTIIFDLNKYNLIDGPGVEEFVNYTYYKGFSIKKINENWKIDSVVEERVEEKTAQTSETTKDNGVGKNLVVIKDEQNIKAEGKIYEYISEEGSSAEVPVEISYIVNGNNKGNLQIKYNNKVVYNKKAEKNIIEFNRLRDAFDSDIYVLYEDGTVGKISISNIKNNKYDIVKVENCKNIVRIQELVFEYEGSGANYALVAVDSNGKIVTLATYSV